MGRLGCCEQNPAGQRWAGQSPGAHQQSVMSAWESHGCCPGEACLLQCKVTIMSISPPVIFYGTFSSTAAVFYSFHADGSGHTYGMPLNDACHPRSGLVPALRQYNLKLGMQGEGSPFCFPGKFSAGTFRGMPCA